MLSHHIKHSDLFLVCGYTHCLLVLLHLKDFYTVLRLLCYTNHTANDRARTCYVDRLSDCVCLSELLTTNCGWSGLQLR